MFQRILSKRASIILIAAASAASAGAAVGCSTTPDAETAEEQAAPRGPADHVAAALETIEMTPQARAEADLAITDLRTSMEPVRSHRSAIALEIAKGIRAGSIDHDAHQAQMDAMRDAFSKAKPRLQQSANRLHATLDEDQREDLVDALRDRAEDHRGNPRQRMKEIAEQLELTDDQIDEIKDNLRAEMKPRREEMREKFGAMRERVETLADAFISDDFDAVALNLGGFVEEGGNERGKMLVRGVEIALPTLTPAQRDQLATIVEDRFAQLE